jgi:hypothetical protein
VTNPASDWLMSTWSIRTGSTSVGSTLQRRHSARESHLTRLKAIWAWASRVGGRSPHNRDDLFISLCDPGWAESAGFKRGVNLPGLRVLTDSTSHEHLPARVAWALPGACQSESERQEILRHSADVSVYVEYSSKTLTGCAQLCWKCTHRPLRAAFIREHPPLTVQDARVPPPLDQLQHPAVLDPLTQHRAQRVVLQMVDESAEVTVDHLTNPVLEHSLPYLLQGLMRAAAWAKAVGDVAEILLVDRLHQHRHGLGHDLVL